MILVDFIAYWPGDYPQEDKEVYKISYGDDQSNWPKSESYSPVIVDITKTIRVNPGGDDDKTVIDLCGGSSLTLAISYEDYKKVLRYHGIKINNSKDAL